MSAAPSGIITPLITPFTADEEIDLSGLRRLIDFVVAGGVHAVFALGTSGEFVSLTESERQLVMEKTVEFAAKRTSVWVGVSSCATRLSVSEARKARAAGACGVVMLAPYYYSLTEPEIERHVHEILRASELPVLLYQNPSAGNGTIFSPDFVQKLSQLPGVVGIKDSAKNLTEFKQTVSRMKGRDFAVLQGDENQLIDSLLAGAAGGICSLSNAFPRFFAKLYDACRDRLKNDVEMWQSGVRTAYEAYFVGPSLIASLKTAVAVQDICLPCARRPFLPLNPDQLAKTKRIIERMKSLNV